MPMPSLPGAPAAPTSAIGDFAHLMRGSSFGRASGAAELPIAPNAPFFLRHHPRNWHVSTTLDEPTWLPEVTKQILTPGVNGVRTLGEQEKPDEAYKRSVYQATLLGWVYLSPLVPLSAELLPPGVPPGEGYLRELPCRDPMSSRGGVYHVEAWMVAIQTMPDEAQQWRFHRESYERWLVWLVESGLVAPPAPRILQPKIERQRDRVERARTLNLAPDLREERIARHAEVLARFEAASLTPRPASDPDATIHPDVSLPANPTGPNSPPSPEPTPPASSSPPPTDASTAPTEALPKPPRKR